jgi:hypothetical protein
MRLLIVTMNSYFWEDNLACGNIKSPEGIQNFNDAIFVAYQIRIL